MSTRHRDVMQRLHDAVLETPGVLDLETRLALATGRDLQPELRPYADKVAHNAYRVTDADLEALRRAGYDDDAIFEITVAVAVGVGLHRRDVGLAALERPA